MLLQARSVRIVIVESGGSTATGEILLDSLTVQATPFWPQVDTTDSKTNVGVQEVTESLAQYPPVGGDLASKFPDTYNRFHPDGEPNQVLENDLEPVAWNFPFVIQGFIPQGTPDNPQGTGGIHYDTVVSYIRANVASITYTFSMLDSASKGIVWNVAVTGDVWHEVKVSRKNNTVTVDGAVVGAPVQFDSSYGSLGQLQVTVAQTGGGAGAWAPAVTSTSTRST